MSRRIAVIGVGHLGRDHARILSSLPGAELVAVVDTNRPRAEQIAAVNHTQAAFDYREVIGRVDAVTLAVPTELHGRLSLPLLAAGVHVLVEKPMARTLLEADEMIAAAPNAAPVLAVGPTDRLNPAITPARPFPT